MLGRFGADPEAGNSPDTRLAALDLMSKALARLDSDGTIPAIIGAHLQSAIDALWTSASQGSHSIQHH